MFGLTPEALAFVVFSLGMLVLMGTGMNMGLALGLTGAGMAWVLDFWDAQLLAQNLVAGVDSFPLLAVPFFILAGELMNSGGISRRIIDMAQAWVGHIRGGLGYVAIGAAVLMASMSGSALADTAALATILLPMMRQQGYPMNTSAGLIASGGIIAPIIPPSMPFVIYGVTTNTSISALFVSGIVPGLMMGVGLIFAWRWVLRGMDLPQGEPLPIKDRLRATVRAFWAMLMPLIIIGGHCCPVKSYAPSRISSIGAACRPILFGADLNFAGLKPRTFPGLAFPRSAHVCWQDPVRPGHGVHALDEFFPHRPSLPRQCRGSHAVVRRAVSCHGVRATDLAREPARH